MFFQILFFNDFKNLFILGEKCYLLYYLNSLHSLNSEWAAYLNVALKKILFVPYADDRNFDKFRFEGLKKFLHSLFNFIHNLKSFHFFWIKRKEIKKEM